VPFIDAAHPHAQSRRECSYRIEYEDRGNRVIGQVSLLLEGGGRRHFDVDVPFDPQNTNAATAILVEARARVDRDDLRPKETQSDRQLAALAAEAASAVTGQMHLPPLIFRQGRDHRGRNWNAQGTPLQLRDAVDRIRDEYDLED
jgi:hypothetical protein